MRGLGHKKDKEATRQTNAMVMQHNTLYHKGEQEDYQMSVIAVHDEPVGRTLREGVEQFSLFQRRNLCKVLYQKQELRKDLAGENSEFYVNEQLVFLR